MNSIIRICRLCLETISGNDFNAIKYVTKRMLDKLLLKINLNLSKEPLICKKCVVNLEKSSNFKSVCLSTALSFGKNEFGNDKNAYEHDKLCPFCMRETAIECWTFMLETNGNVSVDDVIQKHIPELNFTYTQDVLTCKTCLAALQSFSSFIMKCLNIEDEISKYIDSSSEVRGQINLYDIQQFVSKPKTERESRRSDTNAFETIYCGSINFKTEIKNEEFEKIDELNVDIKKHIERLNAVTNQTNVYDVQQLITKPTVKYETSDTNSSETIHFQCGDVTLRTEIKKEEFEKLVDLDGNIKDEEIEIKSEHSEIQSFLDAPTSSQMIMKNINSVPKNHALSQQALSEVMVQNVENLDETKFAYESEWHGPCIERNFYKDTMSIANEPKSNINNLSNTEPAKVIIYNCGKCFYETECETDFNSHLSIHTAVHAKQCPICLYVTEYKSNLQIHMLKHRDLSDITAYQCELCSFKTKYKTCLKRHMLIHQELSEVTVYNCDSCSYVTKHKSSLRNHMVTHRSSEIKIFSCDKCSFKTNYKRTLQMHILTHKKLTDITEFKCKSCSFVAKKMCGLETHMLAYHKLSRATEYKCESCSFVTNHKGSLKRHLLVHQNPSEVAEFKCEICSFVTKRRATLKSHMLVHQELSEVKVYKCESCSYVTKHKGCLTRHMLVHRNSEITI